MVPAAAAARKSDGTCGEPGADSYHPTLLVPEASPRKAGSLV